MTTLVVQSSQALQPDYNQLIASLLIDLVALSLDRPQGSSSFNTTKTQLDPLSFVPSLQVRWINGLWFTSLVLSLVLALLAVLIKQWLQAYVADISGSLQERARIRFFRYTGILKWRLPDIISTLPILMHAALFLFLMGLIQFLLPLDQIISLVLFLIVSLTYMFFIVSSFLPLLYTQCPYKTPLSQNIGTVWRYMARFLGEATCFIKQCKPFTKTPWCSDDMILPFSNIPNDTFYTDNTVDTIKSKELAHVFKAGDTLDAGIVTCLATTSVDPRIISVALQALGGLRGNFTGDENLHRSGLFPLIEQAFQESLPDVHKLNELSKS